MRKLFFSVAVVIFSLLLGSLTACPRHKPGEVAPRWADVRGGLGVAFVGYGGEGGAHLVTVVK